MDSSIHIRQAEPGDAAVAAVLLYSAYTHRQVTYPLQGDYNHADDHRWIERLEDFFRREGNRFSYQNVQVATHNAGVLGLVLSFAGRDEARLNATVGNWLEREAADDAWYVDALAVFIAWEHRGIGTLLVFTAEQQARQHGYANMALSVAPENTPALALYAKLHYEVTQQVVLYERPYLRMAKALAPKSQKIAGTGSAEDHPSCGGEGVL
jgi:ribosomal protein S18 acetylase RimI-like enzyme